MSFSTCALARLCQTTARCTTARHSHALSSMSASSFSSSSTASTPLLSSSVATLHGLRTSHDPSKRQQDKLLFTPGPLTTSYTVKQAMATDLGSRDKVFIAVIRAVQAGLLRVAGVSADEYVAVPIQGSGTFGVESVVCSVVDKAKGGLLVIANGAYGLRIAAIAKAHGVPHHLYSIADNTPPSLPDIDRLLSSAELRHVTHVAVVHSETTSGIINDIHGVGQLVHRHGRQLIVDAMSSFGAVPIDLRASHIHYLVSSANKCIEGVPGFSFVLAHRASLATTPPAASSLSLDLRSQSDGIERTGQFRFTPPTHAMLAFHQALSEFEAEGGVEARQSRYKLNQSIVRDAFKPLGFHLYLPPALQGHIISGYRYPTDGGWDFDVFYGKLNERGFVIYPGKVSQTDCFRIGHIGRIFAEDTRALVQAVDEVCREMKTAKYATH